MSANTIKHFYDLTNAPGSSIAFSPYCIRTLVDLKILNLVDVPRKRLTFHEIRTDLDQRVPGVTVPTLELNDGKHIVDSWEIAKYLAANHERGHLLFPSTTSKFLAAFITETGMKALAPHVAPFCFPGVASRLDEESKKYFIETKIGRERFDKMAGMGEQERKANIEGAHKFLSAVEAALGTSNSIWTSTGSKEQAAAASPWLDAGPTPTHADAVLYGFVVFSRMAGKETWNALWSPFSRLMAWIKAMDEWMGPEITKDYVQWE